MEEDEVFPGLSSDAAMALDGDASDDDDDSEAEDMGVKAGDTFVAACCSEDDHATLEVYCYNTLDGSLFVHHDLPLPGLPLCVAWMDYAGDTAARTALAQALPVTAIPEAALRSHVGSYAAVGTFKPEVEVWSLDVLDAFEPALTLAAGSSSPARAGHTDAVLGLSWNRVHRHMLASGSADQRVCVWDVDAGGRVLHTFAQHRGKVQSVAWNPVEATVLASASYDRTIAVVDARAAASARSARYALPADSECLIWHPGHPACMLVTCEDGSFSMFDARQTTGAVWTVAAHATACTSVAACPLTPGLAATTGLDKSVKLWDISGAQPACVSVKQAGVGQLFTAAFLPQSQSLLAVGGGKGMLAVWDIWEDPGEVTPGMQEPRVRFAARDVPEYARACTTIRVRNDNAPAAAPVAAAPAGAAPAAAAAAAEAV